MKYSTLTEKELQDSYKHMMPRLDFEVVQAGLTDMKLTGYTA